MNVENVNGFLFDSNGDLKQVRGVSSPCIQGISACFESSNTANTSVSLSNPIRFNRVVSLDESLIETIQWQVLSYDPASEIAVVVLSVITNADIDNVSVAPRILVLQKRNFNEWGDAFFTSPIASE